MDVRLCGADPARGGNAAQARHLQVHQYHVRSRAPGPGRMASSPSPASPTTSIPGAYLRIVANPCRTICWSSTSKTWIVLILCYRTSLAHSVSIGSSTLYSKASQGANRTIVNLAICELDGILMLRFSQIEPVLCCELPGLVNRRRCRPSPVSFLSGRYRSPPAKASCRFRVSARTPARYPKCGRLSPLDWQKAGRTTATGRP